MALRMQVLRIALTGVAIVAPLGTVTNVEAHSPDPVGRRITHEGGMNVVPTPVGLGLGLFDSNEELYPYCHLPSNCAVRVWNKYPGPLGYLGTQFEGDVGVAPTRRLANRWLRNIARTYRISDMFSGTVSLHSGGHRDVLVIDGKWGISNLRRVDMRQGQKLVTVQIQSADQLPGHATVSALRHKARHSLAMCWLHVPQLVMPTTRFAIC